MPKEYTAVTKLSDEYKEMDLIIGLNSIQSQINSLNVNNGINNMDTYCRILKTEDFARTISHKQIPGRRITFGEYLADQDTIETILDNINYNYSNKYEILTIGFTDHDPVVAALMLNIIVEQLQKEITHNRQQYATKLLENTKKELVSATNNYKRAQQRYSKFVDSNTDVDRNTVAQETEALKKEVSIAYDRFEKVSKEYIRQKSLKQRSYYSFTVLQSTNIPQERDDYFFSYWISFLSISLVFVKGIKLYYKRKAEHCKIEFGGIFSPWSITLGVWGGMFVLYLFSGDILDPLTSQFYNSISLWIIIFVITSLATFNLLEHKKRVMPLNGIKINTNIYYALFCLLLFLSPMFVYKTWQIVSSFSSDDIMNNVRILAVHGDGLGVLNYALVISQSVLLVALWRYPQIPKWQLTAIILCCLLNSLAIMEKGGIFLVILCSIYVLFERNVIKWRSIIVVGICAILFFYYFNLMRAGEDSDYAKNESLLDFIGMYVMSPPVAYCRVMPEVERQFGTNTFEIIYLFLNRFGIGDFDVHEKVQEFVFVPIGTNVYTIMQPFFRDFGYYGIAFFAWLYGLVSGLLYRLSYNGKPLYICLYTYMVEVLVLQFFQENIFLSMVFVSQIVFFVLLLTQNKIELSYVWRK